MQVPPNTDYKDEISIDHRARSWSILNSITGTQPDWILVFPIASARLRMQAFYDFLPCEHVKDDQSTPRYHCWSVPGAPLDLPDLCQTLLRKNLEKSALSRVQVMPWAQKPRPIFSGGINRKSFWSIVESEAFKILRFGRTECN